MQALTVMLCELINGKLFVTGTLHDGHHDLWNDKIK